MLSLQTGLGSHDVMTSRVRCVQPASTHAADWWAELSCPEHYKSSNADAVVHSGGGRQTDRFYLGKEPLHVPCVVRVDAG